MASTKGSHSFADQVAALDWRRIAQDLDDSGNALIPGLLGASDCRDVARWYAEDARFRSRVVMASHGFGRGEYKYFAYPLPQIVATLRATIYAQLAPIANRWNGQLRNDACFPAAHGDFLARCRAAGQ